MHARAPPDSIPLPPHGHHHHHHHRVPRNVGEIFTRWAVEGSCGDLMYSGHTTHGMVLTLIIVRYAPGLRWAQATAVTAMVLLALALLAFRSHYTSDVIVAVYVCLMIWRLMPPEPGRLDGDALQIEEHGHDGGVVRAGGRSGVGGGNGHTAAGSAAASSSPAESFASAQQQRATGAEKQQSQQPLDGAVFADAREALDEEDGLEEGRRKEA